MLPQHRSTCASFICVWINEWTGCCVCSKKGTVGRQGNISYILCIWIQISSYTDTLVQSYLTWLRVGQIYACKDCHQSWLVCVVQRAKGQQTHRPLLPGMICIHDVHGMQNNRKKCPFSHCQGTQVNTAHYAVQKFFLLFLHSTHWHCRHKRSPHLTCLGILQIQCCAADQW